MAAASGVACPICEEGEEYGEMRVKDTLTMFNLRQRYLAYARPREDKDVDKGIYTLAREYLLALRLGSAACSASKRLGYQNLAHQIRASFCLVDGRKSQL